MTGIEIAAAVVLVLAPFSKMLLEAGAKKLVEVIAEKGGEAAWKKAQEVFAKLKPSIDQDRELGSAFELLAAKPEDKTRQEMLSEVLAKRLEKDKSLSDTVVEAMGGPQSVVRIVADNESQIERVRQRIAGTASLNMEATNKSRISDIDIEIN